MRHRSSVFGLFLLIFDFGFEVQYWGVVAQVIFLALLGKVPHCWRIIEICHMYIRLMFNPPRGRRQKTTVQPCSPTPETQRCTPLSNARHHKKTFFASSMMYLLIFNLHRICLFYNDTTYF